MRVISCNLVTVMAYAGIEMCSSVGDMQMGPGQDTCPSVILQFLNASYAVPDLKLVKYKRGLKELLALQHSSVWASQQAAAQLRSRLGQERFTGNLSSRQLSWRAGQRGWRQTLSGGCCLDIPCHPEDLGWAHRPKFGSYTTHTPQEGLTRLITHMMRVSGEPGNLHKEMLESKERLAWLWW